MYGSVPYFFLKIVSLRRLEHSEELTSQTIKKANWAQFLKRKRTKNTRRYFVRDHLRTVLHNSDCYFELTTCFPDEFKPLISPKMVLKDDIFTLFLKTFQMLTLPNTTFWTAEFQFPMQKNTSKFFKFCLAKKKFNLTVNFGFS